MAQASDDANGSRLSSHPPAPTQLLAVVSTVFIHTNQQLCASDGLTFPLARQVLTPTCAPCSPGARIKTRHWFGTRSNVETWEGEQEQLLIMGFTFILCSTVAPA